MNKLERSILIRLKKLELLQKYEKQRENRQIEIEKVKQQIKEKYSKA